MVRIVIIIRQNLSIEENTAHYGNIKQTGYAQAN